jgi:hypothetical protein
LSGNIGSGGGGGGGPRSGMTIAEIKMCQKALDDLQRHKLPGYEVKYASPFLAPLDWKAAGLSDYLIRVARPMDLGTVTKKLHLRTMYATPAAFADDVRLVFFNAMSYNNCGHDVYVSLSLSFRKLTVVERT